MRCVEEARTTPRDLSLLLISLMVSLILAELGVRILGLAPSSDRFLMFSSPSFLLDSNSAVRYVPDQIIRTAAVYDGRIEYDVRFQTNNLGFVDHLDYTDEFIPGKRYFAFVGDSFTAGLHTGAPWVPELRDAIVDSGRDIQLYNLGVSGTGVEHFRRVLTSTAKHLSITDIALLAISDDFRRRFWYPITDSLEIHFCAEIADTSECLQTPPVARVIEPSSSQAEVLTVARSMRSTMRALSRHSGAALLKRSRLLTLVARRLKSIFGRQPEIAVSSPDVIYSLGSLRAIRDSFPEAEIHLIHLPQRHEVAARRYALDIRREVEAIGVDYFPALIRCRWSEAMYLPNDPHPNRSGYAAISDCVSGYLFDL